MSNTLVEHAVDIMALAATLPLDCPCNGPQVCRGGTCYHRTGVGGCDHCENWGVKTQTIVNAAYEAGLKAFDELHLATVEARICADKLVAALKEENERIGNDIEKLNAEHFEESLKSIEQQRQIRELTAEVAGLRQHVKDLNSDFEGSLKECRERHGGEV